MTNNSRLPVTCDCGKTIQQRNFARHCASKYHVAFISLPKANERNHSTASDCVLDLTSYLRGNGSRANPVHIQTIVQRYEGTDPYTKVKFNLLDGDSLPTNFHIDHIHEAQMLACAIRHTPEFVPRQGNVLALLPLRRVLNDLPNLTITEAGVNLAKGQAIRYFLGHYETNTDMSLLATFMQTVRGKERSIAHLARSIVDVIQVTSSEMSESIRELRMDHGHVTGAHRYELVAEQFDTIIDRMKLDWSENIKLRSGKIYQACK